MTTFALLMVLAAALSHAVWNAMIKGRSGGDPLAASTGLSITWALIGATLLLLSRRAGSFITGASLYVDGGFTAMRF